MCLASCLTSGDDKFMTNDIIVVDCDKIQLVSIENNREKDYDNSNSVLGDNIMPIYPGTTVSASSRFNITNIYDYKDDRICFNEIYTLIDTTEQGDMLEITRKIVENNYISKFNMRIPL